MKIGHEGFIYGLPSLTVNTYGVGSVDNLAHTGREKWPHRIQFWGPHKCTQVIPKPQETLQTGMMCVARQEVISLQDP